MMRKVSCVLALIFLCIPSNAVANTDTEKLYFILDGSGSMWGRVEGRTKIAIAKEVLENW